MTITGNRIHIFGASGTGTTTLGKAISETLRIEHFNVDNFYWVKSDPPYQMVVPREERQKKLMTALQDHKNWVLSGSLCGWGDFTIPYFTKVVFLYLSKDIRIDRIKKREIERYGTGILEEDHAMYQTHLDFLSWANDYDDGGLKMRSKLRHEEWIKKIPIKVIKIEGKTEIQDSVDRVIDDIF